MLTQTNVCFFSFVLQAFLIKRIVFAGWYKSNSALDFIQIGQKWKENFFKCRRAIFLLINRQMHQIKKKLIHRLAVCRQVSLRQNEKQREQMFVSRLDSAHSRREPICRSAAQLFMGRRDKAVRMRLNPLSFSNNLGFRTPPSHHFCSHWAARWPMGSSAFKGASKCLAFYFSLLCLDILEKELCV